MPAQTVPQTRSLLTLQEAAHARRVGYSTLRKRVADGTLPAERVGRRIYVDRAHLDAMGDSVVGRPRATAEIDSAVARVVAAAPRLTTEQRERLAVIIGGVA
ncbi:MAG: helix-turn-helix domain-containing protein [Microbacterium sp.]|nr:helix-turn-helix domain-containing protein [Microbacterium sp.]